MTEDGRLLRQWARSKSQTAFSALVARHKDLVYAVCLRETQDAGLAEDTAQVVFLLLARKAASFGPDARLSGWLFGTARFACRNAQRRESSRRQAEQKVGEQMERDARAAGQSEDALWAGVEPGLNDALASLGAKDREAVLLRFAEGLTFPELGAALGTSEDAARMRLTRAVARLRRFFATQGVPITAATLAALLAARTVHAAPASLAASLSRSGATALSPQVSVQLHGVIQAMTLNKLKLAATLGVGAALVGCVPFLTLAQTQKTQTRNSLLPTSGRSVLRPANDQSGAAVLAQAARATAALHSLSADVEGGGSLEFQRPAQYRSESPGTNGQTTLVNGSGCWFYMHWDKKYQKELDPDLKADRLGLPVFSNFFFDPGLQGLRYNSGLKPSAATEVRLLGTKQRHGGTYTAVQVTLPVDPSNPVDPISGTLTVYVGADHLLHGYALDALYRGKKTTDECGLKNLRVNPHFADSEFVWTPPTGASPSQPPTAHL